MPTPPSPRMGLVASDGADPANTIDDTMQTLVAGVDSQATLYGQGTLATRPVSTVASPGKQGRVYYATDEGTLYYDTGTSWALVSQMVGDVKQSARLNEHGGWIRADGRALTVGVYPQLRAALIADGNVFGVDAGNPRIPDLRQRTPVGAGGSRPIGQVGGEEAHVLTLNEMAYHSHGGSTTSDDRDHVHQYVRTYPGYRNNALGGSGVNIASWDTQQWEWGGGRNTGHYHGIYAEGGNWAHNNMQPFQVVQFFVFGGPAA